MNIQNIDKEIKKLTKEATDSSDLKEISAINIAPRIRMTMLYSIASEITELYRDMQEHDMGNRMEILEKEYVLVMDTINHLD